MAKKPTTKRVRKQNKEEYFVQIGLRRNGRIVKNESYTLDEFKGKFFTIPQYNIERRSFLDRLTLLKGRNLYQYAGVVYVRGAFGVFEKTYQEIKRAIDEDVAGRKRRK